VELERDLAVARKPAVTTVEEVHEVHEPPAVPNTDVIHEVKAA
jgi:hypothetical protein